MPQSQNTEAAKEVEMKNKTTDEQTKKNCDRRLDDNRARQIGSNSDDKALRHLCLYLLLSWKSQQTII